MLIIIFGNFIDVWNLCFFRVILMRLYSPHLSMRYPAYWSSIVWCVCVLFPSHTLIFSLGSAINSLVTKLMTTMKISKECVFIFREYLISVMAIFICTSSQNFHLRRMSKILRIGIHFLVILLLLGYIFWSIIPTFIIFNLFLSDGTWSFNDMFLIISKTCFIPRKYL